MIKQALAGVAVIGTVSGAALAQTYISMSPAPVAFVPPSVVAPERPRPDAPPLESTGEAATMLGEQRLHRSPCPQH
jgi:hypothetical protein